MWLYSYFLEDVIARGGRSLLVVYFVLPLNYLSEWSPMEQRAPAQWFVTRPVSLRPLRQERHKYRFYWYYIRLLHESVLQQLA